jgi:hypothetical protein
VPSNRPKGISGIGSRKLACGPVRDWPGQVRRPLEGSVVVNHDHSVAGQVHVELQALGPERQAAIEGRHRVLGRERTPAAVREHPRPASVEERM